MSTSLSSRTFVLFLYEPCANTSMLRALSLGLSAIASPIMRSALPAFSCSVSLEGFDQLRIVCSQSLAIRLFHVQVFRLSLPESHRKSVSAAARRGLQRESCTPGDSKAFAQETGAQHRRIF